MATTPKDIAFLRKVPLFSSLSDAELRAILASPANKIQEFPPKQIIIREMEIADAMYVVLEGMVDVSLRASDNFGRDVVIATLRAGDFFGEQALADNTTTGRRSASVRAVTAAKLFRIDRQHVRLGVKSAAAAEDATVTAVAGAPQDKEVRALLKSMRLFQSLTEDEMLNVGSWAQVVSVGPGEFVLKESERGDCMYAILGGTVEIFTHDSDGKICILAELQRGNYFGEQALLPGSSGQRSAYARTNGVAQLVRIPKEYFRLVLNRDSEVARNLLKIGQVQRIRKVQVQKGD
ncbi:MAG: cyclic nucleotide-binding domain-containing protein [Gammaproteobacteria bacterium]|nr:cyclic nucleotide-binding domain-containing protein [Gammaproteobacteria bacterium]